MTYAEFTQKHIETLKMRMLDAKLEIKPPRCNFPTPQDYLWNIEKQCKKAGISIEIDPLEHFKEAIASTAKAFGNHLTEQNEESAWDDFEQAGLAWYYFR